MSDAIIRTFGQSLRAAGGAFAFVRDWGWLGGMSAGAVFAALAGEGTLTLVFG